MPGILRTFLDRLTPKWPLLLALAFSVYSAALLAYSIGTWWQMKQDANNFLVADSQRPGRPCRRAAESGGGRCEHP
jgi:hypothetical protein